MNQQLEQHAVAEQAPGATTTICEQRAALSAQLAAATSEYNEAVARAATEEPKAVALKHLAPLRERIKELTGALEDLAAVAEQVERAKAEDTARREAELLDQRRRDADAVTTKYEAAGIALQHAIEALGPAYQSFEDARLELRSSLRQCREEALADTVRELDEFIALHLLWTAGLRRLPGFDQMPGRAPARTVSAVVSGITQGVRGLLRDLLARKRAAP